ncbi:MAG: HTH domain-containing protein, partial [Atopobiaceae bacterium]|nr:HTH domain-containing protein [Atopobiaceae bacterium]
MAFDKDRFLDVLASRGDWVDARFIADTFGVTTRTVRNYVKKLNDESESELVESSYRGYRLRQDVVRERPRSESSQPEDRADVILRRLISTSQPISIYDLADELCVSDSTIETDLRRVRDSVRLFDLTLARN